MDSCDHTSVGILVWQDNKLLLIERKKFPFGFAPPAGHLDGDSYEEAAKRELREETGLELIRSRLLHVEKALNNCQRPGGSFHQWQVFEAEVNGGLNPNTAEVKQIGWYSREQINELAEVTESYLDKKLSEEEWQRSPGLETVWYDFFKKLKIL